MSVLTSAISPEDAWQRAYKESLEVETSDATGFLLSTLGPRIAATALGMTDARQLRAWRAGQTEPRSHELQMRLRLLFRITCAVAMTYGPSTAALFLRSASPRLGEQAPMIVLRDNPVEAIQVQLLAATRSFLEG